MTEPPLDPLPADIQALLERERSAYPEDLTMKAAVLSHTEVISALRGGLPPPAGSTGSGGHDGGDPQTPGPAGPGAGSAATALSGRMLAAVGTVAFVAGGVVGSSITRQSPPPSVAVAPASVTQSATATAEPSVRSSGRVESPAVSAASRPAASASDPPAPPAARGDLTRERELLDAARAALSHGRPGDALAAAERHAAQWPRGYLGEEREVVIIQALAALGRRGEAEQRADRYRKTHPKSLLLPSVDAVVPPR